MEFSPELQQNIEKWANLQGLSSEQFVSQAILEKITQLSQMTQKLADINPEKPSKLSNIETIETDDRSMIYRKEGILVINPEFPKTFDINTFIDDLREERIQDIMAL
jgi:hypothetical protein